MLEKKPRSSFSPDPVLADMKKMKHAHAATSAQLITRARRERAACRAPAVREALSLPEEPASGGCFGFRFHGTKAYHGGPRERDATAGLAPRFNRKKRLRYSCHQALYPKLKKVYCSCSKRCIITAALMKETLQRVSAKIRILFFGGGRIFHLCRNAFRGGEHSPPDFFIGTSKRYAASDSAAYGS